MSLAAESHPAAIVAPTCFRSATKRRRTPSGFCRRAIVAVRGRVSDETRSAPS